MKDLLSKLLEKTSGINSRISPVLRKKVNAQLYELGKVPQSSILQPVIDILRENNIVMLQEDNTRWSGILTGREGRVTIEIGDADTKLADGQFVPYTNSMLVLSWHKLESGKYEVVAYLS